MFTFNSRKSRTRVSSVIKSASDGFATNPAFEEDLAAASQQAKQIVENATQVTQQRSDIKHRPSIVGFYVLDDHVPHTDEYPGLAKGHIHLVPSDADGDGVEDRDEIGRQELKTYIRVMEGKVASGEYTKEHWPMAKFSDKPRVTRWMRKSGMTHIPIYLSKDIASRINQNRASFTLYTNYKEMRSALTKAAEAGYVFPSATSDINNPNMRILTRQNGLQEAINGFYTNETPTLDSDLGAEYCAGCGNKRDKHRDGSANHEFIPGVIPGTGGSFIDGNTERSRLSPLRQFPEPTDISALSYRQKTGRDYSTDWQYDQDNSVGMVNISDQPQFHERYYNHKTLTLLGGEQTIGVEARPAHMNKKCGTCRGSAKINSAREGVAINDQAVPGFVTAKMVTDPVTGELTLEANHNSDEADWAIRGTQDNVCPDCDPRRFKPSELAEMGGGTLSAEQVFKMMEEKPGYLFTPAKPAGVNPENRMAYQTVQHIPGNPVTVHTVEPTNAVARQMPDQSCSNCHGSTAHQQDGKPCDCTVANPSNSIDLDNPVPIPGMPLSLTEDGNMRVPVPLMEKIINESHAKVHRQVFGEGSDPRTTEKFKITRIGRVTGIPDVENEKIITDDEYRKGSFLLRPFRDTAGKKRGITRLRGRLGVFSHFVNGDGSRALSEDEQQRTSSILTNGVFFSQSDKAQHAAKYKEIMSGPNAKELGPAQMLKYTTDWLRENITRMSPSAGADKPPITRGTIPLQENLRQVHAAELAQASNMERFAGIHEDVMPNVAHINRKINQLKSQGVLRSDDHELTNYLRNIYGATSDIVNDLYSSAGGGLLDEKSDRLNHSVAQLAGHIAQNYGKSSLNAVMPDVLNMTFPYLPQSSRLTR